jgi:hypothetical protein
MNDAVPKRKSFWRESLRSLMPTLKAEIRLVMGFAVVMAAAQYLLSMGFDAQGLADQLKNAQITPAQRAEVMHEIVRHGFFMAMAQIPLYAFSVYVFTTLFLRRAAESALPQFSLGAFLYWLGKSLQKYLFLLVPLLLPVAFLGIVIALGPALKSAKILIPLLIFVPSFLAVFLFIFVLLRLSLVSPLAILQKKPVLTTSWKMTKGHCWRIWWGAFVQTIVFIPVFWIPYIVLLGIKNAFGLSPNEIQSLSSLIYGAWCGIVCVAMAVYYCTVYRILLQEQATASVPNQQQA